MAHCSQGDPAVYLCEGRAAHLFLSHRNLAQIEEQAACMPLYGNGGRRIIAEAWRRLASCQVAAQQAARAGEPLPEWIRNREARAWAVLERYGPACTGN